MSQRGGSSLVSPKWPKFRTSSGRMVRWAEIGMVLFLILGRRFATVRRGALGHDCTFHPRVEPRGNRGQGQGTMRDALNGTGWSPVTMGARGHRAHLGRE